jgi:ParB family transcriptional regulator, chromosome partitioning protein
MPKRPDIKEIGLKIVKGGGERHGDHPVHHLSANEGFLFLPISLLRPDPEQPRQHFDNVSLDELTASVKEKGVLQPVLARKDPNNEGYILIAGERRWRAAAAAGLTEIPTLIRNETDHLEVALIENLQRENLNAIEEAEALLRLKETREYTDEQLAKIIGKSRSSVTESLTLNRLPKAIKAECRTSDITSKSQLLEVIRVGSDEEMLTLWQTLKSGKVRTVRALRSHKTNAGNGRGRPKNYRFQHKPKGRQYQVIVTFSKSRATREEVSDALKDALKHVP